MRTAPYYIAAALFCLLIFTFVAWFILSNTNSAPPVPETVASLNEIPQIEDLPNTSSPTPPAATGPAPQSTTSAVLQKWSQSIVGVTCTFGNNTGYPFQQSGFGMVYVDSSSSEPVVETDNQITITTHDTATPAGPDFCTVSLPDGANYEVMPDEMRMATNGLTEGADFFFNIPLSNSVKTNLPTTQDICTVQNVPYGENLIVLTLTSGQVTSAQTTLYQAANLDDGYFFLSPKVTAGGGIAIDSKNNCYFGIVTMDGSQVMYDRYRGTI